MTKNNRAFFQIASIIIAVAMVFSVVVIMPEDVSAAAKKPGKVKISKCVKLNQMITVTWKKTKGAKKYQIYIKQGSKKWKKVATVKSNGKAKQTYRIKKLKWNTKYQVKMRAINGKKKGKWSVPCKGKLDKKTTLEKIANRYPKVKKELQSIGKELSDSEMTVKTYASGNIFVVKMSFIGEEYDCTGRIPEAKAILDKEFNAAKMKRDMKAEINELETASGIFGITIKAIIYDSANNHIATYTYK